LFAGLDPGYLTTQPNARGSMFYHLVNADPSVIDVDETTKEVVTATEADEFGVYSVPAVSLLIDAPVVSVVGR
jgi:hypothetical protein